MSPRTGVALVGAGKIATEKHLPIWSACERANLVAVVDVDREAAARAAAAWDVPMWGTSLEEALADNRVDVVDICSPHEFHAEQAVVCLEAGRPVLVEKPAAATQQEVRAVAEVSERAGLVALVCENWVYAPAVQRAKALVDDGIVGVPRLFSAQHFSGMSLPTNDRHGVRTVEGSYFVKAGVHTVNTSLRFMGPFADVSAYALGLPEGDDGCDREVVVAARYRDGGIGSLAFSGLTQWRRPGTRAICVIGTEGRVEFDVFTHQVRWTAGDLWASDGSEHVWRDESSSTGHAEAFEHFLDCVAGTAAPLTSVAQQVASHQAVDAILESMASGVGVRVQGAV